MDNCLKLKTEKGALRIISRLMWVSLEIKPVKLQRTSLWEVRWGAGAEEQESWASPKVFFAIVFNV